YYSATNYTNAALVNKFDIIKDYLNTIKPETLWDFGSNTGRYSNVLPKIPFTVAFDKDPIAIEHSYIQARNNKCSTFLPLVMDLTNPRPNQGWAHDERQSLELRGKTDTLMAVALNHHLTISNNI